MYRVSILGCAYDLRFATAFSSLRWIIAVGACGRIGTAAVRVVVVDSLQDRSKRPAVCATGLDHERPCGPLHSHGPGNCAMVSYPWGRADAFGPPASWLIPSRHRCLAAALPTSWLPRRNLASRAPRLDVPPPQFDRNSLEIHRPAYR